MKLEVSTKLWRVNSTWDCTSAAMQWVSPFAIWKVSHRVVKSKLIHQFNKLVYVIGLCYTIFWISDIEKCWQQQYRILSSNSIYCSTVVVHLLTDLHRKCRWKWTVRFYDQSCTTAVLTIAMQHVVAVHRPPQIEVHHNLGLHYRIRWNTDSWNELKAKTTNFQNRTGTRMFTVACFCLQ